MNLQFLQDILETISVAGINEVIFTVNEDHVLVSGIDESNSTIVFSKIDDTNFDGRSVGIFRIPILIKRLRLFDLIFVKSECTYHGGYVNTLVIRQGKKSVSYTFANPGLIRAPKSIVEENSFLNEVVINKKKLGGMIKAVQALNPEFISFVGIGSDIVVQLKDQVNDKYEDIIGTNKTGDWTYKWRVNKLLKLLKYELKNSEEVKIVIDGNGFMKFVVNDLQFILPQQI